MNEKRMHLKDENCLIKEAKKQHSFLKPKTESIKWSSKFFTQSPEPKE